MPEPEDKSDPVIGADATEEPSFSGDGTIGRIALKQVRVSRAEIEARNRGDANVLNRLVPYLDLFGRLTDEELSRLARTPTSAVETLRVQVDEVNRALGRYADLLPRLSDDELVRLTGATPKTIRFWRLSQPRSRGVDQAAPQPLARRESSGVREAADEHEGDRVQARTSVDSSVAMAAASSTSAGRPTPIPPDESGTMVIDEAVALTRSRNNSSGVV